MALSLFLTSDPLSVGGAPATLRLVARPRGGARGGQVVVDQVEGAANDHVLVNALIRDGVLRQAAPHPAVVQTLELSRVGDTLIRVREHTPAFTIRQLVDAARQASTRLPAALGFAIASALFELMETLERSDGIPAVLTPTDVGITPAGDVVLLPMALESPEGFVAPEIEQQRYRPNLSTPVWAVGRLLRVLLSTSEDKSARPKVSPSEVEFVRPVLIELLSPRRSRRPDLAAAQARIIAVMAQLGVEPGPKAIADALAALAFSLPLPQLPPETDRVDVAPAPNVVLFSFGKTLESHVSLRVSADVKTGMTSKRERKALCGVKDQELLANNATLDGSFASPFSSMASHAEDADAVVSVEDAKAESPLSEEKVTETLLTEAVDFTAGQTPSQQAAERSKEEASPFETASPTLVTEITHHSFSKGDGQVTSDGFAGADSVSESEEDAILAALSAEADAEGGAEASAETEPVTILTDGDGLKAGLVMTQDERPPSSSRSRDRKKSPTAPHSPDDVFATASAASPSAVDDDSDAFASRINEPSRRAPAQTRASRVQRPGEATLLVDSMTLADDNLEVSKASDQKKSGSGWKHATGLATPRSLKIDRDAHRAATAAAMWGLSTGAEVDDGAAAEKDLDALAPFPSTLPGEDVSDAPLEADNVFAASPSVADSPADRAEKTEIRAPDDGLTTSMTSEFVMSQEAALKVRQAAERAMEEQRARVQAIADSMAKPSVAPEDPWEQRATLDGSAPVELPNALVGRQQKAEAPLISPVVNPKSAAGGQGSAALAAASVSTPAPTPSETPMVTKVSPREKAPKSTELSHIPALSATESGAIIKKAPGPVVSNAGAVLPAPAVPKGASFADDEHEVTGAQTTNVARAKSANLKSQAGSIDVFQHVSQIAQEPAHVSRLNDPPVREPTKPGIPLPSYELVSDEEKGVLVVEARAGATVFLDGIWRGVGRVVITELDRFASYSVRVHCPGFAPWSGSVSLGGEVAARVRPTLAAR